MTQRASDPTDEAGSEETVRSEATPKELPHAFLRIAKRNLSEEELQSPTATRFLIAELERQTAEIEALRPFRDRFYETKEDLEKTKVSLAPARANERLASVALAMGAAGLGAGPALMTVPINGILVIAGSVILVVCSFVYRLRK